MSTNPEVRKFLLHMKGMLALTLVVGFLSLLAVSPTVFAVAPSSQYATYGVSATGPNGTVSATVNETITPTSTAGFSTITLQLISTMSNFSYSKFTNSSFAMFPYIPSIGNQSFNFETHNYSISVSISQKGTGSASVSGATYTTTNYDFSVTASKAGEAQMAPPMSASGTLSALPSGLLYSAQINANGIWTVNLHLVATNLSPNADPKASSTSSSETTGIAIAGSVGTIAAAGVGAFAFYKHGRKNSSEGSKEEQKPLYNVD